MKLILDLALSALILTVIGVLFVGFSIFLGKYELLLIALVLVGASSMRSLIPIRLRHACECIPIIGEGLEIFNMLERHYLKYQARSVFYYLFYPITSLLGFILGSDADKRELGAYFHLIRWLVILLVIESATLYYDLAQHFSVVFTIKWLYLELLCLYFLANLFMVPLSTLSLELSVGERRARLLVISVFTFALLTGLTAFFDQSGRFYQVIPMNVVLEQRFQSLEAGSPEARTYRLRADRGSEQLSALPQRGAFFSEVERELIDLLMVYLPQWRERARREDQPNEALLAELNARLQKRLQRLSIFDEHELFYLSLSAERRRLWGVIMVPFRESILYYFKYERDRLTLYDRWAQLTPREQRYLSEQAWDQSDYQLNSVKRLAQLVTQHVTEQVQLELKSDLPVEEAESREADTSLDERTPPEEIAVEPESVTPSVSSKSVERRSVKKRRNRRRPSASRREPPAPAPAPAPAPEPTSNLDDEAPAPVTVRPRRRGRMTPHPFIIYDRELQEFDYSRALTKKLIRDHQGAMPELVKLWWTDLYEALLTFFFWMFKLSMPLHILIILYCKVKWGYQVISSERPADQE